MFWSSTCIAILKLKKQALFMLTLQGPKPISQNLLLCHQYEMAASLSFCRVSCSQQPVVFVETYARHDLSPRVQVDEYAGSIACDIAQA